MAHDDPLDIEMFFVYLLWHARFASTDEFPQLHEAIEKTRKIINRTFIYRQKIYGKPHTRQRNI